MSAAMAGDARPEQSVTGDVELGRDVADRQIDEASAASMDASDPPAFGGTTGVGEPAPQQGSDEVDRQQQIRDRAYRLWDAAGCPENRELDFWLQAEREIAAESFH